MKPVIIMTFQFEASSIAYYPFLCAGVAANREAALRWIEQMLEQGLKAVDHQYWLAEGMKDIRAYFEQHPDSLHDRQMEWDRWQSSRWTNDHSLTTSLRDKELLRGMEFKVLINFWEQELLE